MVRRHYTITGSWERPIVKALNHTEAQLITELLSAALDELEASLPYVKGAEVIAEDDQGDPIYADDGLAPRFHALTGKYTAEFQQGFELEQGC